MDGVVNKKIYRGFAVREKHPCLRKQKRASGKTLQ